MGNKDYEFKSCPFCGSDKIELHYDEKRAKTNIHGYIVYCECCWGGTGYSFAKEDAIKRWNKRV